MATMTVQADADAGLADYNTKLAAVVTAFDAMVDVQFAAVSYANASAQAAAVRAAGAAKGALATQLALASDQGASLIALVKPLLPA